MSRTNAIRSFSGTSLVSKRTTQNLSSAAVMSMRQTATEGQIANSHVGRPPNFWSSRDRNRFTSFALNVKFRSALQSVPPNPIHAVIRDALEKGVRADALVSERRTLHERAHAATTAGRRSDVIH